MKGKAAILVASVFVTAMFVASMPAVIGDDVTTNVSVNNVAPEVTSVTVTPSYVALNPCPNSTPILVEAEVADDNGADDIVSVQITALRNSSGGDASGNIDDTLPLNMIYNESTGKYEAILHLNCTTANDTYSVEVTATDKGGSSGVGEGNFTVGPTVAIEIDFNAVSFGAVDPGSESSVPGDDEMETVGQAPPVKPTIKNSGNTEIDVSLKITDDVSNPSKLFEGNTSAVVDGVGPETLTGTLKRFDVNLQPGNTTNLNLTLSVPTGTPAGEYSGTLTIEPTI